MPDVEFSFRGNASFNAVTAPSESWWDALGRPVPAAQRQAALDLLVGEGLDAGEAAMVLSVVCREIAHDQPERAMQYVRSFVGRRNETLVIRTLATLAAPIFPTTYTDDLLALRDELQQ